MNNTFMTLGSSNHTDKNRENNDFYATDPIAASLLLELETFENILEPSCGQGHLSEVFIEHGIETTSSDLIDRGYGIVKDFYSYTKWDGDIITNPPFKGSKEFIQHALNIIKPGNKVAMFLKLQFMESKGRKQFFIDTPPQTIYVSSSRIQTAKNAEFERMRAGGGSAIAYGWFVWKKSYYDTTQIKWFN